MAVPAYTTPFLGTRMRWGTSVEGDSLGIYSAGGEPSTANERLAHLEDIYDHTYAGIRLFRRWNEETWNTAEVRAVASRGLWLSEKARLQSGAIVRYDDIVAGDHDAHIIGRAQELKALYAAAPFPFLYFTPQHEPEGEQSSVAWGSTPYGTQANAYKAFFQYYRELFLTELLTGADALDVPIAFGPIMYAISYNDGTADNYWPGDEYCDFVGADAYNWYPAPGRGPWRELQNAASAGGVATFAIAHDLYACLGELGCFEAPPSTYDPDATSGAATRWDSTTTEIPQGPPYDRNPADAALTAREVDVPGQRSKAGYLDRARTWLTGKKFTSGDKAGDYVFQQLCWFDATGDFNRFSNTHPNTTSAYYDLVNDEAFGDADSIWGGVLVAHCDICSPTQYNVADGWGNTITLWDDPMGTLVTTQRFAQAQLTKVRGLRAHFPTKQFHLNNYESQDISLGYVQDLVLEADGVTMENWLAKYSTVPGANNVNWTRPQDILMWCAENDAGVLAWPRWEYAESTWATQAQHKRFAYGSYLLAWRPGLTRFLFGSGWGVGQRGANKLNLPEDLFYYDLGTPLETFATRAQITQPTTGLYKREYSKGIVLVNITGSAKNYTIPAGDWYRVGNNSTLDAIASASGTISVPAYDAVFLVTDDSVGEDPSSVKVTFAEMEVGDGPRGAQVTFAEMETGDPPDRGVIVSFAVMRILDPPLAAAYVTWAEMEVPDDPDRFAKLSWAEVEIPGAGARGALVEWAEMQVPDRRGNRRGGMHIRVGIWFNPFRIVVRRRR